MRLDEIAYARSGDKGGNSNVGVIAKDMHKFLFLREFLTEDKVMKFFLERFPLDLKSVKRYELSNLLAFNFLLEGILGEGGTLSLRTDAQGKVLGQVMLEIEFSLEEFLAWQAV